jgi:hypothetical protein
VTLDDFWALIERSAAESTNRQERTDWLTERLAGRSPDDIVEFETHLTTQRKRVDTWLMWGVGAHLMQGYCSTDGFFYFQPWLVGLGRDMFERVVADPDALADAPEVQRLAGRSVKDWADEEWPEWESLNYVALHAYEQVTGEEDGLDEVLDARGDGRVCDPEPDGEDWDYMSAEERGRRIPRLAALLV